MSVEEVKVAEAMEEVTSAVAVQAAEAMEEVASAVAVQAMGAVEALEEAMGAAARTVAAAVAREAATHTTMSEARRWARPVKWRASPTFSRCSQQRGRPS